MLVLLIYYYLLTTKNIKSISNIDIYMKIKKDPFFKKIFFRVFTGKWQKNSKNIAAEIKPYYNHKDHFIMKPGCLL